MAEKINTKSSLVSYLMSTGADKSDANIKKLAESNGITNYAGTDDQNNALLNALKTGKTNTATSNAFATNKSLSSATTSTAAVKANTGQTATANTQNTASATAKPAVSTPTDYSVPNVATATEAPTYTGQQYDYQSVLDQALEKIGAAPVYKSNYMDQIDFILGSINNRDDFSYDQASDPLYQQYKTMYTNNGNVAMRDTAGNAAALTGGYGNSYATTAASQVNNQYMGQLNEQALNIYDRAYQQYADETAGLYNQYGALTTAEDMAYQKYLQSYNQYNDNANRTLDVASDTINYGINQENTDYSRYQNDLDQYNYNNEVAQNQANRNSDVNQSQDNWQQEFDTGNSQWEQSQAQSQAQWQQEYNANQSQWNQEFNQGVTEYNQGYALDQQAAASDEAYNAAYLDYLNNKDTVVTGIGNDVIPTGSASGTSTTQQTATTKAAQVESKTPSTGTVVGTTGKSQIEIQTITSKIRSLSSSDAVNYIASVSESEEQFNKLIAYFGLVDGTASSVKPSQSGGGLIKHTVQ